MPVSSEEIHQQLLRKSLHSEKSICNETCFDLYPGSRFVGKQKSKCKDYNVTVEIKHVDLAESFLCGYLHINDLTEDLPEMCTFFEAEIIGPKHSFLTRKWGSEEKIDKTHWMMFPQFQEFLPVFNQDDYKYDFEGNNVVFMRWKEDFLVPDHKIRSISGASFAGFYYIAYEKSTASITGFYYHKHSEQFQKLTLEHVSDHSFPLAFEFR